MVIVVSTQPTIFMMIGNYSRIEASSQTKDRSSTKTQGSQRGNPYVIGDKTKKTEEIQCLVCEKTNSYFLSMYCKLWINYISWYGLKIQ